MKKYLILFIAFAIISCGDSPSSDKKQNTKEVHDDHDGHDHDKEKVHDHDKEKGHDHADDKSHDHGKDGHHH